MLMQCGSLILCLEISVISLVRQ
uniref:Uncharacterized protein n=1 Tax=Arundo donax TaxID=35708 RepID=A0A0A9B0R1_ARUDO